MKVTQIMMECLLEQGVDTVFGYPGGTILNVYDELYRYSDKIRHILTAHEQGASHAADGYARSTGKVGVCFATSGPGATNLTTGIATAYMDSSPVVFITCNVAQSLIGKDSFQEVDITGITMPITKTNYLVRDPYKIADIMREAFAIAASGRPGPVMIDIPKDITAMDVPFEPRAKKEHFKHGRLSAFIKGGTHGFRLREPNGEDIDILINMIQEAERPMIIAGGGIILANAGKEFREFAERIDTPVATTLMGIGSIPADHPLCTGMIGMHGTVASNRMCAASDLIVAIGTRFSDRVASNTESFGKGAKIVHIDIDRAEIDKNVISDHHITGDAKRVLEILNSKVPEIKRERWRAEVDAMRANSADSGSGGMQPKDILQAIWDGTGGQAIITTDVGQHQMWSCQHFNYQYPRQLITSGGFGTMGFGLGAAMGSKLGNPDKTVVLTTGDGCFRMNCNELATIEHYNIPVIIVVFNNGALGMVRQWQTLMYGRRYSSTTLDRGPDFVKLAGAYGISGARAENIDEFKAEFERAVKSGKPAVIDCKLDIDELVRPMVPGGKPITGFIIE
ncbi:MAG: biosynthetic-type acetolactate synthase large subunit [Oscillospiraceae bacterium]|jgi:acetolactate synthase-1/2/3 large subunit